MHVSQGFMNFTDYWTQLWVPFFLMWSNTIQKIYRLMITFGQFIGNMIVHTKLIAEMWERSDITEKKWDRARKTPVRRV